MKERNASDTPRWDGNAGQFAQDIGAADGMGERRGARRVIRWVSWLLALAMIAAVIIVSLHFSEERELVRIAERAEPWWLGIAVILQAGTYLAQGETWRAVTRAAGVTLPLSVAFKLSLAKLFIDQALPSGGISGTVVVAAALEQHGVPRAVVMASMVVATVAYYAAYVLALAVALLIMVGGGHANPVILATALFFVVFSTLLTAIALALSGRRSPGPGWFRRIPMLRNALALLEEAAPALARSVPLLLKGGLLQLAIVLLDTATIWILIRSLGVVAAPTGVFASFMVSTLLRTISIVPGGLGVFEAASVVTLSLTGVSVPVALAATLLFRGFSFWLPMVPGLVFSRSARKAT